MYKYKARKRKRCPKPKYKRWRLAIVAKLFWQSLHKA